MTGGAKAWLILSVAVGLAAVGGGAWWIWSSAADTDGGPQNAAEHAGTVVAEGTLGAVAVAADMRAPYECARWAPPADGDAEPEVITAFGRRFERTGPRLAVDGGNRTLVVGFVADARGASERTLERLAAVRGHFEAQRVELVVTLGGMGRDADEIAAVLDALSRDASWPVLAIPGGREALPAHREAVARVADAGRGVVFDGAAVRLVRMDGATVATLPGIAEPSQLMAGNDGCVHRVDQLMTFARALAEQPAPRVVATYAPPRQRGETGSDLAAGGVHIGEVAVAEAVAAAEPVAVVHGLVDEAAGGAISPRLRRARARPLMVGAGSVEADPLWLPNGRVVGGSAVVLSVARNRVSWRRIGLPVTVD